MVCLVLRWLSAAIFWFHQRRPDGSVRMNLTDQSYENAMRDGGSLAAGSYWERKLSTVQYRLGGTMAQSKIETTTLPT